MSTSSSDSWILTALTILVVLLLFYLSKKMICNSYGSSDSEEDSPTTSPSSSTTSFSDYYHDGRYPLDLADARNTTSSGSSPETDDVAIGIGIADSIDYSDSDHRWHHYRVDNQCSGSNNRGTTNNNRNYLDLSDSVTCNGRRMSCDVGGTTTPAIGIGRTTSGANNRRMDCSGLPLTSSATGSQHPILSSISIIASPDFDRKTMLESQLRNQIAKIVQAESEIQRLVQLLAVERRQELNSENNNNVAASNASGLHNHHQTYSQSHHHPRVSIPPSSFSTVTNTSTSSFATITTANMGTTVANSTPTSYNGITPNNAIPSSFPHENDAIITPHVVPVNHGDDDYHHHPTSHENNSASETTSPGNHYPHDHHHHHRQNENFPSLSDLLFNSNCMRSQALAQQRQLQQQLVACGIVARAIDSSRPRRSQCACNLCYSAASNIGTRARRMLMLRRMLLQTFPTTFPIDTNANVTTSEAATTTQRDFLTRPVGPSACDVHYRGEEQREHHVHHSQQPAFSDYSHHQHQQHHGNRQQNQRGNDDPPPYEECIRSDRRSQQGNDHQNLYTNNNMATCNIICDNQEELATRGSISTQA